MSCTTSGYDTHVLEYGEEKYKRGDIDVESYARETTIHEIT